MNKIKKYGLLAIAIFASCITFGQSDPSFSMVPNPANRNVLIQLNGITSDNKKIELYSVLGTRIDLAGNIQISPNTFVIKTESLPEGVYLLRIKGNTFDQTRRLKIQH